MDLKNCSVSNSPTLTTPKKRPPLALLKRGGSVLASPELNSASSSRESAFSFHQNPRNSLLFGKNSVFAYDGDTEKPGYLSLLQDMSRLLLILKWTPNALLHHEPKIVSDCNHRNSCTSSLAAVSVRMETITHLHLHQTEVSKPICVVLIDSDGVQQFTFKFILKQHCMTFLKALETGLSPLFRIDPSLDSIKFKDTLLTETPMSPNQSASNFSSANNSRGVKNFAESSTDGNTSTCTNRGVGLVFRIVSFATPASSNFSSPQQPQKVHKSSLTISQTSTQDSRGEDQTIDCSLRESLAIATKAMQSQILGRAFHGWLSYCRHIRTIRTNLATIVLHSDVEQDEADLPVNEVFWRICRSEKTIPLYKQFLTRVYFYGIDPELRLQTWPYLLRVVEWHEDFGMDKIASIKKQYDKDIAEWIELERELNAKVQQDGIEQSGMSRQNSEYGDMGLKDYPTTYSSSVSSDVFDDSDFSLKETDDGTVLTREFGVNLSRIQKDVDRCDRVTKFYSKAENLELLRRIMCTYVYRRLKTDLTDGYVQGMCDLLAPLLVIIGDEALTLACFERLMLRMVKNFPPNKQANSGMEENLNYFRYLVEVMDPELYGQLMRNVDYSFVVFYRWLLLDFKREFLYNEIFQLWEVIWAAEMVTTRHFGLFFGLALLTQYREILIENEMDFTDVIKFFNEMAEKHDVRELLDITRKKIRAFQEVIQELNRANKD